MLKENLDSQGFIKEACFTTASCTTKPGQRSVGGCYLHAYRENDRGGGSPLRMGWDGSGSEHTWEGSRVLRSSGEAHRKVDTVPISIFKKALN